MEDLRPGEEKLFEGQPKGFPFGDFDLEDVMLPEGSDLGVESGSDEEDADEAGEESGFATVIVLDNLPKVGPEKQEKLAAILRKLLAASGPLRADGLHLPTDPAAGGATRGFAFVEYESPDAARAAAAALDGYQLDKAHRFTAVAFDDLDRLAAVPDAYAPPPERAFDPPGDLGAWLDDARGRDQFVARFGDESEIAWNDPARQGPEVVYARSFWTEAPFVAWSPRGAYAATLHAQGVAIWGGPDFRRLARFAHPAAQRLAFSPCERYLLAFSEAPPAGRAPASVLVSVFDLRSGRKLRSFEGPAEDYAVGAAARPDGGLAWPAFKWSGGDSRDAPRFLAHMKRNALSVYAAPDMAMLDKRSVKLEGLAAFEWSPGAPAVLAAYQEEQGQLPARVVLLALPSREEIRAKNLFSVADVRMAWHPQGDYLAVRVEKWTKTRKSTTTALELFSLRERDVPADMLELPNKAEKVLAVAWEPKGHRFAVLHADAPGSKPTVSIFSMKDPTKEAGARKSAGGAEGGSAPVGGSTGVHLVQTLPAKAASHLLWSPAGRFLLLAGLAGGHNGKLEWWDVDEGALLGAGEHFMATDAAWDPTGRYVSTATTVSAGMENGFQIWSFAGQSLYKAPRERLFQFAWRPRPPSLLSAEAAAAVARDLKRFSRRYEAEDEALLANVDAEAVAERDAKLAEWAAWRAGREAWAAEQAEGARALLGARWRPLEEESTIAVVEVSAVVDAREEVVKA
jgi:translation initiation factor 3 subunit B